MWYNTIQCYVTLHIYIIFYRTVGQFNQYWKGKINKKGLQEEKQKKKCVNEGKTP